MPKFDAGTQVEELEWDFTKYNGEHGVIPEPTTAQIKTYFNDVREVAKQVQGLRLQAEKAETGDLSDEETAEILASMEQLDMEKFQGEMKDALAKLCSGFPGRAQLDLLPHRILQAFMQWVTEQFRPEAQTATTRR